jgi:hypothetical protein
MQELEWAARLGTPFPFYPCDSFSRSSGRVPSPRFAPPGHWIVAPRSCPFVLLALHVPKMAS